MRLGWQELLGSVVVVATLWGAAEASRLAFEVDNDNIKRRGLFFAHMPCIQGATYSWVIVKPSFLRGSFGCISWPFHPLYNHLPAASLACCGNMMGGGIGR